MDKTSKRVNRIFMIIMGIFTQGVFVVPWISFAGKDYSTISYFLRLALSGDIKENLTADISSLNAFNIETWEDARVLGVIFLIQIVVLVVAQVLCLINLGINVLKECKIRYHVGSIIPATAAVFLYIQSPIMGSSSILMNWYCFFLLCILCLIVVFERMISAWRENELEYNAAKKRDQEAKRERKERLEFEGNYSSLFAKTIWKNFKYNWKTYRIFVFVSTLASALIISGYSLKEMLSSTYEHENLIMGQGLGTILLSFILVIVTISAFLIISVLMFYLKTHVRNYGIFLTLGMRKRTLYIFLAIELLSCIIISMFLGVLFGKIIHILCCKGIETIAGETLVLGQVTYKSYLYSVETIVAMFVISVLLTHEIYVDTGASTAKKREVEREKMPGRICKYGLILGALLALFGIFRSASITNFESTKVLAIFFAGVFLLMYFGIAPLLRKRKANTNAYYSKLLENNQFYYKYASTIRYLFLFTVINVGILFIFGKGMISGAIATPAEEQFPYDYVCMATSDDEELFEDIQAKANVTIDTFPMVRVCNVDNSETPDNYSFVIYPQGQQIGISESTYKALCELGGREAGELSLAEDGSTIGVIFQQDQGIVSHPLDYFVNSKTPYLHIGQPLEMYDGRNRMDIFVQRKIAYSATGALVGNFRQGHHENIVIFNDAYFDSVKEDWQKFNAITGEPLTEPGVEDLTLHHWPDRLVLLRCNDKSASDYIDASLKKFEEHHAYDNKIDCTVLSCYAKAELVKERSSENILKVVTNGLIVLILALVSCILMYIKGESELREKRRQSEFLKCMGMNIKDRKKLLRKEREVFLFIPMILGTLISILYTAITVYLRQMSGEDVMHYFAGFALLWSANLAVQFLLTKAFEYRMSRKIEGR